MKYDVILADPPWDFEVWNRDTGSGRSAISHYDVMSLDDICNLPIAELASENCALFMWAVWPRIFDAKTVIEAWGFEYKTLAFDWFKTTKNGKAHFGMGYYFRANPEPCLLAVKGNMPVSVHNERNWMAENVIVSQHRGHSVKPDEQYEKIERVYPNKRYLELFARRKREGWDSWGNEIESDIVLNGQTTNGSKIPQE